MQISNIRFSPRLAGPLLATASFVIGGHLAVCGVLVFSAPAGPAVQFPVRVMPDGTRVKIFEIPDLALAAAVRAAILKAFLASGHGLDDRGVPAPLPDDPPPLYRGATRPLPWPDEPPTAPPRSALHGPPESSHAA